VEFSNLFNYQIISSLKSQVLLIYLGV